MFTLIITNSGFYSFYSLQQVPSSVPSLEAKITLALFGCFFIFVTFSIVLPLIISVSKEFEALAEPQPTV